MMTVNKSNTLNIPQHIAIILDGNGRWAKKRGLPRKFGHRRGSENVKTICAACIKQGVKYLTVYAFSTENWQRPDDEVNSLMQLVIDFFRKYDDEMAEQGIRLRFAGNLERLPLETLTTVREAELKSAHRNNLQLIICLNYGGHEEIARACLNIHRHLQNQELSEDENRNIELVTQLIDRNLYISDVPAPDLMIRTGGDLRISNFLLWQLAYSELYFTPKLWPNFDADDLDQAIKDYQSRQRRFGRIQE